MVGVDEGKILPGIEADMTQGAPVVLSLQQCRTHWGVHCLRHASMLPDLPVALVVGIERAALSLDLAVPGDRDVVCRASRALPSVKIQSASKYRDLIQAADFVGCRRLAQRHNFAWTWWSTEWNVFFEAPCR